MTVETYVYIGLFWSLVVIFLGRKYIIYMRRHGADGDEVFCAAFFVCVVAGFIPMFWGVVLACLAVAWLLGAVTLPEAKAFVKKQWREMND